MASDQTGRQVEKADGPPPISPQTLGRCPILDLHHLDLIRDAVGLSLAAGVAPEKFIYQLNVIVERTIGFMLKPKFDRTDHEVLVESIQRYLERSRSLIHAWHWPPQLPADWIARFDSWNTEVSAALDVRKGAPRSVMIEYFLPRAVGLYSAAFGQEPDTVVSRHAIPPRGGAYRLVEVVGDIVRNEIALRSVAEEENGRSLRKIVWSTPARESVAKQIKGVLASEGYPLNVKFEYRPSDARSSPATGVDTRLAGSWRHYAEMYRALIASY